MPLHSRDNRSNGVVLVTGSTKARIRIPIPEQFEGKPLSFISPQKASRITAHKLAELFSQERLEKQVQELLEQNRILIEENTRLIAEKSLLQQENERLLKENEELYESKSRYASQVQKYESAFETFQNKLGSDTLDGINQDRKKRADFFALSMMAELEILKDQGVTTLKDIATALNEKEIPTVSGEGVWYPSTVKNIKDRLKQFGEETEDITKTAYELGQGANQQRKEDFIEKMAPIFKEYEENGVTTLSAIANALNEAGIQTSSGKGKWHITSVKQIRDAVREMEFEIA